MRNIKPSPFPDYLFKKTVQSDQDFAPKGWENYEYNKNKFDGCNDFFNLFHENKVEYNQPSMDFFKKFVDEVKESSDYKSLKQNTTNNAVLSHFAAKEFHTKLMEAIEEKSDEYDKLQDNPQDKASQQKLEEFFNKNKAKIKSRIRRALRETKEDIQDIGEALVYGGWDLSKPTNDTDEDTSEQIKFANFLKNTPNFKEIIDMIGRSLNEANHQIKTSTTRGSDEIVGVTLGSDLADCIPSQLAYLNDPDLALLLVKDKAQGTLPTWQMKGKEVKSKGKKIVIVDESGSMRGELNTFAKSFAFGCYLCSKEQHKEMHIIRFASYAHVENIKSERDCLNYMYQFMGGGTSYNNALLKAISLLNEGDVKDADVFFLTDGDGDLSDETLKTFNELKEKIGFKVLAVNLDNTGTNETLKKFSDKIWNFTNIKGRDSLNFLQEAFSI